MDQELTEADIPGSSLGDRKPNQLTVAELKFWLKCRNVKISKLKTKAQLVSRVQQILADGNKLPICDPTEDGLYSTRKSNKEISAPTDEAESQDVSSVKNIVTKIATEKWSKSLRGLPDFSDVNIRDYMAKSGKKVNRSDSLLPNEVTKQTAQRPETRGFQFYTEKYVHDVWTAKHEQHLIIKAKCFRSQRKNEAPHSVLVSLHGRPTSVADAHCSCVAGASGFCNHVFALLHTTRHYSRAGFEEIPSDLSRTSQPQMWDKPRITGIRSEPIMEVDIRKAKNQGKGIKSTLYEARVAGQEQVDTEKLQKVQDSLKKDNPLYGICYMPFQITESTEFIQTSMEVYVPKGSPLSYQLALSEGDFDVSCNIPPELITCIPSCDTKCFPQVPIGEYGDFDLDSIPPEFKDFFSHKLIMNKQACSDLEKETRDQATCEKWWKARQIRLTASRFGEIARRRKTDNEKFLKILTEKPKGNEMTRSLKHGKENESIAIDKYVKYMSNIGRKVSVSPSGFMVRPDIPFLGCTPDGKVMDPKSHPHYGLLEVKCPYSYRHVSPVEAALMDDDFYATVQDEKLFLKKSHKYYFQVQGQMALMGAKWCDFVIYTNKGLSIQRIKYDDKFWMDTYSKLEQFYFSHFLPHVTNDGQ